MQKLCLMTKRQKTWASIFKTHPKYDEFLASRSGSHPKRLLTLKHQVSYLITLKTVFQNILPCLNIPEFVVFLLKLNYGFPKKTRKKPIFFPSICTLFAKIAFFRIWLLLLYGWLFENEAFLSKMLLIFKTCKKLNYNSYLAHNYVYLSSSILNLTAKTWIFFLQTSKYLYGLTTPPYRQHARAVIGLTSWPLMKIVYSIHF